MQSFHVQLERRAEKHLRKLRKRDRDAVSEVLLEMEINPFGGDLKKLAGDEGYRRRVGRYRILFDVDTDLHLVSVYGIRSRGDAYRLF